jgi:hypothetical protein
MPIIETVARALFRAAVPSWFREGLSFNAMQRQALALGMSYRRKVMLTDFRSITGLIRGEYAARGVRHDVKFPQAKMIETDLARDYKYRVHGRVNYEDRVTGESFTKQVSLYSDRWLSLEAYGREFEKWKEREDYESGVTVTSTDFAVVEHNSGLSY